GKQDWDSVRAIQNAILDSYDRDFSKHVPAEQLSKVRDVWAAIPSQLGKAKKRFKYTEVSPGSRARTYESAIGWLTQAGLACRVDQISAPRLPLASYADERGFKLYQLDVGLLGAQSKLDPGVVVQGDTLFTEFKGSLAEQFVASHLVGALGSRPYYWVSQGTAEVDFVVQLKNQVVPIEVKSGGNVKAKSLAVYRSRYAPKSAVRLSPLPYRAQDGLVNLPLYAVQHLPSVLS
ncbi:MAG: DUF4143 domain-containing protein, partial [Propionibacteriaceae bacterium]|nr:DUF4143 domain-containing protein [Propionibacteriaceae bacterium]